MKYLLIILSTFSLFPRQDTKPLPELNSFLAEFRKTFHSDGLILSRYTYTARETRTEMRGNKVEKNETQINEVFPGVEAWQTTRRLVSRNGVPLSPKELEQQDREQGKRLASGQRQLQKKTPEQIAEARSKEERQDAEIMRDIFGMYDVRMVGRGIIDERPVINLSFTPRPGFKSQTDEGKMWQRIAGEVWISESDHELVRIRAEFLASANISLGAGMRAIAPKGARLQAERRKFNDEVWLPARIDGWIDRPGNGKSVHQIVEYVDHKKYSVETIIRMP